MSTRANIIIKDDYTTLWFYRHSDGYPDGTMPTLKKFMSWVKEGKIRDNVSQAAGWLIMIGASEYNVSRSFSKGEFTERDKTPQELMGPVLDWKVGAYEPTGGKHGDIEYIYTVDLKKKTITYEHV